MPAYELRLAEPQEKREELERQFDQLRQECVGIRSTPRNHIKRFLTEHGVWDLSEMDYPLRLKYEDYLKRNKASLSDTACLHTFDRIKLYVMKKEMQTLAGRKKYELNYADEVLFLPYYPKPEIAEQFILAKDKDILVWDFRKKYAGNLKEQIFKCLDYVVTAYGAWERKEKLSALQYLYHYCGEMNIDDLELMTLEQETGFAKYLPEGLSGRRAVSQFGIIDLCRRNLFLQADQIHWHAQVWYLERFHFSKERVNPSNRVESVSFREITQEDNKKYLKEYMRYALGITDMALSSIRMKFYEIRNLLQAFDKEEKNVCELRQEQSLAAGLKKGDGDGK